MRSIYGQFKEFSFLLAGTLLAFLFPSYQSSFENNILLFVVILMLLILFGMGIFDGLPSLFHRLIRNINRHLKKIGVFAPYDIDSDNSSWVNVSLRQLNQKLLLSKINFKVFNKEISFRDYPVVVNPYGGVYPEKNLSTLTSFKHIIKYVRSGGIYVNISDIPFYYAYDINLDRRIDTTPFAGPSTVARSFTQTLLTTHIHNFVIAINPVTSAGVSRIISVSKDSINYYKKLFSLPQPVGGGGSPQLAIPFGKGWFLFSTVSIDNSNLALFVQIIKDALNLTR
jgi:hypothetical protein